jgi:hypothetical protein
VSSSSFGTTAPRYCVFLPWVYRPNAATTVPTCDGRENFLGEGELPASSIVMHTHTSLVFTVPPGLGSHSIAVSIAGNPLRPFTAGGASTPALVYSAPVVTSISPARGPASGGAQLTVAGFGFGPAPTNTSATPVVFPADGSGLPLGVAATLPTVLMRVNIYRGCVADGYNLDGSLPDATRSCTYTVISHSDTSLVLLSARGIGINRVFNVSFTEGTPASAAGQNVIVSNALVWNFDAPTIALTIPPVMLVADAASTS